MNTKPVTARRHILVLVFCVAAVSLAESIKPPSPGTKLAFSSPESQLGASVQKSREELVMCDVSSGPRT